MSIRSQVVFRDVNEMEIREGDHVVPVYESGARPRNLPVDARRGQVVGFGSQRVYVRFEGDQFYQGLSDFHRIYARNLAVTRTSSGVLILPGSKRGVVDLYLEPYSGTWMLELPPVAGNPFLRLPLGRQLGGAVQWDTMAEQADSVIAMTNWRRVSEWAMESGTKGQAELVSDPFAGNPWLLPGQALDLARQGDHKGAIRVGVAVSFEWLANRLAEQYPTSLGGEMIQDIRNLAGLIKPSEEA